MRRFQLLLEIADIHFVSDSVFINHFLFKKIKIIHMKNITVWYNGKGLIVSKEVADLKNLKHGHIINSKSEFWEILNANCTHNIDRIKLIQPIHEKSIESLN